MRKSSRALGLARAQRLRHAAAIQAVFRQGQRAESRSFVALWQGANGGRRAGFAVSRQVGDAVDRNRVRRRLREAYRREQAAFPGGVSVMFVGRPAVLRVPFEEIVAEMRAVGQAVARRGAGLTAPRGGES